MTSKPDGLDIKEPRQIRALASIARQDIADVLEAEGPCTMRELAEILDTPADTLYYHVKILLRVGILRKSTTPDGHLLVDIAGRPARLIYDTGNRQARQAIIKVVFTIMRSSARKFARAFRPGLAVVSGDSRNLWAGHARGRLTRKQLQEVNDHIAAILRIVNGSARADSDAAARAHDFSFVLSPLAGSRRKDG